MKTINDFQTKNHLLNDKEMIPNKKPSIRYS